MDLLRNSYSSVIAAFLDLKDFGKIWATLYRDLGVNDVIFKKTITDLPDSYMRYRLIDPVPGVRCIVVEISNDPDRLEISVVDAQRYFVFDTSTEGSFSLLSSWNPETNIADLEISANRAPERYYGKMDLNTQIGTMFHQNILVYGSAPNFRITNTPYMKSGA